MRLRYDINLLSKSKKSFYEALFEWLLNYFKHIVVLTQIVIVFIFLYRLKIDIEIDSLQEKLFQSKAIISSASDIIEEYETKAYLISEAEDKIKSQKLLIELIDYLSEVYPADFFLEELIIRDKKVELRGFSLNYRTILRFYNRLKKDGRFEDIFLGEIIKDSGVFKFSIVLSNFLTKE